MCGIVGYCGDEKANKSLIEGLESLEYRGYDSAGIALIFNKQLKVSKSIGRVQQLSQLVEDQKNQLGSVGIGHTRWATHGKATTANAHPHTNQSKTIAIVHNGIIENYQTLKIFLQTSGYNFSSETDSEVIVHLIDYYLNQVGKLELAFEKALNRLQGAYAVAMVGLVEPEKIYAAKLSSPLVIGSSSKACYIASDPTALPADFNKVVFLDDYEYAVVTCGSYKIKNFKDQKNVEKIPQALEEQVKKSSKGDYEHFMLKEIHDAPETIRAATAGRIRLNTKSVKLGGLEAVAQQLRYIDRIVIVACGTSYYAAQVGEYLIEEIAGVPVEVQLASEFKYRKEPFSRSTALLAISQSGETADTIAALKKVEKYGVLRLGIVNAPGSTIARMTDAGVYCHAGPEYSVASTKAFIAQVSVLSLIALELAEKNSKLFMPILKELSQLDKKAQLVLNQTDEIKKLAKKYANYKNMMFIGRRYGYPTATEGALKLKEVSYIHAEGYAAGETKHGPLAMIDKDFPTIAICPKDDLFEKTISNIEEIKARNGKVIVITDEDSQSLKKLADNLIIIPSTLPQLQPILSATALQLFAYYVALEKNLDIDRPRNLAKSVTVE